MHDSQEQEYNEEIMPVNISLNRSCSSIPTPSGNIHGSYPCTIRDVIPDSLSNQDPVRSPCGTLEYRVSQKETALFTKQCLRVPIKIGVPQIVNWCKESRVHLDEPHYRNLLFSLVYQDDLPDDRAFDPTTSKHREMAYVGLDTDDAIRYVEQFYARKIVRMDNLFVYLSQRSEDFEWLTSMLGIPLNTRTLMNMEYTYCVFTARHCCNPVEPDYQTTTYSVDYFMRYRNVTHFGSDLYAKAARNHSYEYFNSIIMNSIADEAFIEPKMLPSSKYLHGDLNIVLGPQIETGRELLRCVFWDVIGEHLCRLTRSLAVNEFLTVVTTCNRSK